MNNENSKELKIDRTKNILKFVAITLFAIQFLFLIYANFGLVKETLDNDVAKLYLHVIKMWEHKTIFVPNWNNMTTLELDCASLLALPIYAVTKNIYVSFAISNIIFAAIYCLIVWSLLGRMKVSEVGKWLGCALVITPFSFGQLLYYNMMFFAGGQYVVKTLIPLLLIWLLTSEIANNTALWYVAAAAEIILMFINGMSSAAFVLAVGVLPVAAAYVWLVMLKEESLISWLKMKKIWLLAGVFIAGMIGIFISKIKHTCGAGMEFALVGHEDIFGLIGKWISGLSQIFGALPSERVSALSINGIMYFARFILLVAVLLVVAIEIKSLFSNIDSIDDNEQLIKALIIALFMWNSLILIVGGMGFQCRYMLISVVPVLILVPIYCERMGEKIKKFSTRRIVTESCIIVAFAVIMITSDYAVKKGDCTPAMKNDVSQLNQIAEIVKNREEKTIVFYDFSGGAEMLRMLDYGSERDYQNLEYEGLEETHGWYANPDGYELPNEYLLANVTSRHSFEDIPEDIREHLELVEQYQIWDIYRFNAR